jgi:hypothetical protein
MFAPAETGLKPRATARRIVNSIERRDQKSALFGARGNGITSLMFVRPVT